MRTPLIFVACLCLMACPGDFPGGSKDGAGPTSDQGPRRDMGSTPQGDGPRPTMGCDQDCKEYVLNRVLLPSNNGDAEKYALVIGGKKHNALGALLSILASQATSTNIQEATDNAVNEGNLLLLLRLDAKDLQNQANANAQIWIADTDKCCADGLSPTACATEAKKKCFAGDAVFKKGALSPDDMIFNGAIQSGELHAGPSSVRFSLQIRKGMPFPLTLKHAFISGQTSASGVQEGVLNGAIPQSEIQGTLIPELAAALDELIKDPTGSASTKDLVKKLFDLDKDGSISTQEVSQNSLIGMLLAGDVDVDNDGEKELSFGVGFTAVPCTITTVGA